MGFHGIGSCCYGRAIHSHFTNILASGYRGHSQLCQAVCDSQAAYGRHSGEKGTTNGASRIEPLPPLIEVRTASLSTISLTGSGYPNFIVTGAKIFLAQQLHAARLVSVANRQVNIAIYVV